MMTSKLPRSNKWRYPTPSAKARAAEKAEAEAEAVKQLAASDRAAKDAADKLAAEIAQRDATDKLAAAHKAETAKVLADIAEEKRVAQSKRGWFSRLFFDD